jgi:hypothetical protein
VNVAANVDVVVVILAAVALVEHMSLLFFSGGDGRRWCGGCGSSGVTYEVQTGFERHFVVLLHVV